MSGPPPSLRLLGATDSAASARLRQTLLFANANFTHYAAQFRELGVSETDLAHAPPLDLLRRLPLLDGHGLYALSEECLRSGAPIIDVETSSGTTGPRKRRFITPQDDATETGFLTELFAVCGVGPQDSAACLDTDPLTLMVSFTKALDAMGVRESYALSVGAGFRRTIDALPKLAPTVMLTIPSVLERCLDALIDAYARAGVRGPRIVIYVGEPLGPRVRHTLKAKLGATAFGYYGASETSALGVECGRHDGIHLFTDRNLFELAVQDDDAITGQDAITGEIVVTTLRQRSPPLLRYALRDRARAISGDCPCGLPFPRVDVLGRAGDSFSVLGAKLSYGAVRSAVYAHANGDATHAKRQHDDAAVYAHADEPAPMRLELSCGGDRERLTIVLPAALRSAEPQMRRDLIRSHPDIDFLVGSRLLSLDFAYAPPDEFNAARKTRRIVDLR